jgi:hypothetical protein
MRPKSALVYPDPIQILAFYLQNITLKQKSLLSPLANAYSEAAYVAILSEAQEAKILVSRVGCLQLVSSLYPLVI